MNLKSNLCSSPNYRLHKALYVLFNHSYFQSTKKVNRYRLTFLIPFKKQIYSAFSFNFSFSSSLERSVNVGSIILADSFPNNSLS